MCGCVWCLGPHGCLGDCACGCARACVPTCACGCALDFVFDCVYATRRCFPLRYACSGSPARARQAGGGVDVRVHPVDEESGSALGSYTSSISSSGDTRCVCVCVLNDARQRWPSCSHTHPSPSLPVATPNPSCPVPLVPTPPLPVRTPCTPVFLLLPSCVRRLSAVHVFPTLVNRSYNACMGALHRSPSLHTRPSGGNWVIVWCTPGLVLSADTPRACSTCTP